MMRRILMFMTLLIFGVLLTVAVAWACVLRPFPVFPTANDPRHEAHQRDDGYDATIQIMQTRTGLMQWRDRDLQRSRRFVVQGEPPEAFDTCLPASPVFRAPAPPTCTTSRR